MKTLICVFGLLLIFFTISKRETINNIQEDFSPEEIVKQFIDFAIESNEDGVKSLITTQPDSYTYFCKDLSDKNIIQNSKLPVITLLDDSVEKADSTNTISNDSGTKSNGKFLSLSDDNVKNSLAILEAEFLYASHSIFNNIKILNTTLYQDEAVVDVEYIGPGTSVSKRKFLLKKVDGWKIFDTFSPESLNLIINENYAKSRPLCEQKE